MIYENFLKIIDTRLSPVQFLGARGSILSRWQANYVAQKIEKSWPHLCIETKIIKTEGDLDNKTPLPQIGGKGVFTVELEKAIEKNEISMAVHSFKDLPVDDNPNLIIGAILKREDPRDTLISRQQYTLETLPKGAHIGTSSTRRAAQLLFLRPDLNIENIRGNIDTRIRKALDADGKYDAIVIAYAGLIRIGLAHLSSEVISIDKMLPAPAQGALAVQCLKDSPLIDILSAIDHLETRLETQAERAFLKALGGGCSLPVAAFSECIGDKLKLRGSVIGHEGQAKIEMERTEIVDLSIIKSAYETAALLGQKLANQILEKGADKLLKS